MSQVDDMDPLFSTQCLCRLHRLYGLSNVRCFDLPGSGILCYGDKPDVRERDYAKGLMNAPSVPCEEQSLRVQISS